jgi:hypothetical protein
VHFLKTNNFAVEWHLRFEVTLGENAFECALVLFTGAEKTAKLACSFCLILWVKHLSAFAIMEEGYLIYIFAIQWKHGLVSKLRGKLV